MTEVLDRITETETQPMTSMDGLHGRLVLANQEFLNPETPVPANETNRVVDFHHRNYQPFENASRNNRRSYWQKEQSDIASHFDAMYQHWQTSIVETFNNEKNKDAIEALIPVLEMYGIDISQTNGQFTQEHAALLYSRYFRPQNGQQPPGVKLFVDDVLKAHVKDRKIDYETIEKNSTHIKWFSHIFGNQAAEMVEHLILAEGKLFDNPGFIKTMKKDNAGNDILAMNHLSDDEKRILRFILANSQETATTPTLPEKSETDEKRELPIMKHKEKIQRLIRNNDNVVIVGPTGSGKTFMTSQFIYEMLRPGEMLKVGEPRQINTEELAEGVAKAQGVKLGEEVGFIHGDNKENYSPDKTKALFATEGIMLKQLMSDPLLLDTTHVMVDEVHVRSKVGEQLLYYLREAQRLRKEQGKAPLKIITVSATVDKEELKRYFNNAEEDEIEEPTYHIEPRFETQPIEDDQMPKRAAEIVKDIVDNKKPGDIVIAIRGKADREAHIKSVQALNPDVRIIEIHRGSTKEEKGEVGRKPLPGEPRRVIIGTDFIQTGVTMDVKHIINTGYVNQSQVDPLSGLTFIVRAKQSQAEIDQWRGRVGRNSPGDAYFLFTEDEYKARDKYPVPEMQRSDISDVLLNLKNRGKSFNDVDFLSSKKIDPLRIQAAEETLQKLGALDQSKNISAVGREMVRLPTDLRLARMIVEAKNQGLAQEACVIAAVSEQIENLFPNGIVPPALKGLKDSSSDFLSYLNIWKAYEESGKSAEWITNNGVDISSLEKIERKLEKLYRSVGIITPRPLGSIDKDKLGRAIAKGFADRVLRYNDDPNIKSYVWEQSKACNYNMFIGKESALRGTRPEYIIFGGNAMVSVNGSKSNVPVSLCHEIKPEWLN